MEIQRWSTRWKTKRWLMDSTVTAFITLTLVLQATHVRAGKIIRIKRLELYLAESGRRATGWDNPVTVMEIYLDTAASR